MKKAAVTQDDKEMESLLAQFADLQRENSELTRENELQLKDIELNGKINGDLWAIHQSNSAQIDELSAEMELIESLDANSGDTAGKLEIVLQKQQVVIESFRSQLDLQNARMLEQDKKIGDLNETLKNDGFNFSPDYLNLQEQIENSTKDLRNFDDRIKQLENIRHDLCKVLRSENYEIQDERWDENWISGIEAQSSQCPMHHLLISYLEGEIEKCCKTSNYESIGQMEKRHNYLLKQNNENDKKINAAKTAHEKLLNKISQHKNQLQSLNTEVDNLTNLCAVVSAKYSELQSKRSQIISKSTQKDKLQDIMFISNKCEEHLRQIKVDCTESNMVNRIKFTLMLLTCKLIENNNKKIKSDTETRKKERNIARDQVQRLQQGPVINPLKEHQYKNSLVALQKQFERRIELMRGFFSEEPPYLR